MGKSFGCCYSSKQVVVTSPPRDAAESEYAPKSGCTLLNAMGKLCGTGYYQSSGKHVPGSSHEAEHINPSLEEIVRGINGTNPIEQIDPLTHYIEDQLRIIKTPSLFSSKGIHEVETVSAGVDIGAHIVDTVSKQAEKLKTEEIAKEMGKMAIDTLNTIAGSHWVLVGLSVVGYALRTYIRMKSNVSGCIELLEKLSELAKDLCEFREAGLGGNEKLSKAVHAIIESTVMCLDYIKMGQISRYLRAATVEESLKEITDNIKEIRSSLTFTGVIHLKRQFSEFLPANPMRPDFEPVGIEKQVQDVKKLLDIGGSEPAIAVILCGFGGVGKSTLATQVIYELDLPSTAFKYCKVTINEMQEKTSHILNLQQQIINDLGDEKIKLRELDEGKEKIKEILGKQCCFLYIDNVVEGEYIESLLSTKMADDKMDSQKLRIIITSRAGNLRALVKIKRCEEYRLKGLSDKAANEILQRIILQDENELVASKDFDEKGLINDVAMACKGVPLLLSVYGNHLRVGREKQKYEEARDALWKGDLNCVVEKQLEQKLLFVYHKLKDFDEEAQEAFLDICSYFQGYPWELVSDIEGKHKLETLRDRMLLTRSELNRVIVHDILLLMGRKEAKNSRFLNSNESLRALKYKSNLENIKGICLLDTTSLVTLESRDLNAMHRSLRVLQVGSWVNFDGPPCDNDFENLRYLEVGDINVFPFEDARNLKNLTAFRTRLNPGIFSNQLPSTLKCTSLEGVDAVVNLPEELRFPASLRHLRLCNFELARQIFPKALEYLVLDNCDFHRELQETYELKKLPEGLKLPVSLSTLILNKCKQVPQTLGCLKALRSLVLTKCDMENMPWGFQTFTNLECLNLQGCTNLIRLPSEISSISSLKSVDLRRCTHLQDLPANFGRLGALTTLWMEGCENLTALPESMDGLSCLQVLDLKGCVKLQRLPESFGKLPLPSLILESLDSLEELPQSIGDLPNLKKLFIVSCNSLSSFPDSIVQLKMLEILYIDNCIKLAGLPRNIEKLISLQLIYVSYCPSLKELPPGIQGLATLKELFLNNCANLARFPECKEGLASLERLTLRSLLWSTLPNDLGKLGKLKKLCISYCRKLQTPPDGIEKMVSLEQVILKQCEMMEGVVIERIAKLQQCYFVDMTGSPKIIERWTEMQQGEENYHLTVTTSTEMDKYEWHRAAIVGLFHGRCIQLDSTSGIDKLITRSSMAVAKDTTIVVINHTLNIERLVDKANERKLSAFTEHLRVFYLQRVESDGQGTTPDTGEENNVMELLKKLPEGSCVIPSSETRRLLLIQHVLFGVSGKDVCFIADVRLDDQGRQVFVDSEKIGEEESFGRTPSSASIEETENLDDLTKFSSSPDQLGCSWQKLSKALKTWNKRNNIQHDLDSRNGPVQVETLEGKIVCLIMCDYKSCECMNLQQIYENIQGTHLDFEAVWIPVLSKDKSYGYGTYLKIIQNMPWLNLPKPKFLGKNENFRVVLFDKEGRIFNQNALTTMLAWGANAYPFTDNKTSEILSNIYTKCSLEFLLDGMDFKGSGSIEVKESINNKVTFLYAEPPNEKLEIKCKLEQLRKYRDIEILYVGNFFNMKENDRDASIKEYENATQKMHCYSLSFWDMVKFWYRCNYLLENEKQLNSSMTLQKLVQYLRSGWLVLFDSDGIVTLSGIDVVEYMIYHSNDKRPPKVELMMGDLIESLSYGKCNPTARKFFSDEISNHPDHPQHHLFLSNKKESFYCDVCWVRKVPSPIQMRRYRCADCEWDLCVDCWEVFAKERI